MARYHRLNLMEREEFSRMLAVGYSLRATAQLSARAGRARNTRGFYPVAGNNHNPGIIPEQI